MIWELVVFRTSNVFHTGKSLHGGGIFLKISFYSLLHFRLFHLHGTYIRQLLSHFITIYDVSLVTCIRVSNSRGQSGSLPRLTGLPSYQLHYAPAAQEWKEDPSLPRIQDSALSQLWRQVVSKVMWLSNYSMIEIKRLCVRNGTVGNWVR